MKIQYWPTALGMLLYGISLMFYEELRLGLSLPTAGTAWSLVAIGLVLVYRYARRDEKRPLG